METHFAFNEPSNLTARRQQLQADLKVVGRDIEELLKSAAGQLSDKATADLKAVLVRSKQLYSELENQASARLRQADQVIRQHPYESIGIAFALGALIGVLANRR